MLLANCRIMFKPWVCDSTRNPFVHSYNFISLLIQTIRKKHVFIYDFFILLRDESLWIHSSLYLFILNFIKICFGDIYVIFINV